jgi:stage V sporulation protein S
MILRVSSKTEPTKLAGAIAGILRNEGPAEMHACGAGSVNQAVKAIAIAKMYLRNEQKDAYVEPYFDNVLIGEDQKEKTIIRLVVTEMPYVA